MLVTKDTQKQMHKYAVVDIETNGRANRVTEIAIVVYQNNKILREFQSLVNPGGSIPAFITALTGISQEMLWDQPSFQDIAHQVEEYLEGCVFVAHNVNFDYNVLKAEFENINKSFRYPKLCTVRLSRKLLPGHKSYSLGNICGFLHIENSSRHRAYGDARATVELFRHLEKQQNFHEVLTGFLNLRSQEATIPSHLKKEEFDILPSKPGVYKFYNQERDLIYVGKAKDIKKRVLSHFYTKTTKKVNMIREIAHVDFELSGTELIALLMEDALIKRNFPKYNKAAKQRITGISLITYQDRKGILHLGLQSMKDAANSLKLFFNPIDARIFTQDLMSEFQLCPKYCPLIEGNIPCESSIFNTCLGICEGKEEIENYNRRVEAAIQFIKNNAPDGWIKQKGRNSEEDAFVRFKNGKYCGYGFVDKSLDFKPDEIDDYLIPEKDNLNVHKILLRYHHLIEEFQI